MARRLTVLGTGYLGATHAACLAELGFDVLGLDTDPDVVAALAAGQLPFYDPGLDELLGRGLRSGRLRFTTSYAEVAEFGDVHFVCVGTPQRPDSAGADLSQLMSCIDALAPRLERPCLIAGKSTIPVGTAAVLAERVAELAPAGAQVELAWNPEFLREGFAVADTLRPERIVVGVRSAAAEAILREVYAEPIAAGVPFLVTGYETAELVKIAANAFLATKISFINAMAEVCEAAHADVTELAEALAYDHRIGAASLRPGLGFGGGCLPKDIRAFMTRATELGAAESVSFLREMDAINRRQRSRMVALAQELAGGVPMLVMDLETAELVKVAANAFLATKISFINAMAEVCEQAGADVIPLAEALGHDARIGRRFLSPGLGFGGGCLPKDVRAFRATASALGVDSVVSLLTSVDVINQGRRDRVAELAREAAGGTLAGKRVAVLGVAFKPNSDDVRDSPSLAVCGRLTAEGAIVSVHDPVAMPSAAKRQPELTYAPTVFEA
ncbi:MAG TPA: nucleotide sugar dehydrogenase, partial [Streptosporangiaceae bacterium]|nr:nucleotide sugar dehydrogenase [Streptosporangiaceae bacterium]